MSRRIAWQGFIAGYFFARLWHEGFSVLRLAGLLVAVGLVFSWTQAAKQEGFL